DVLLAEQHPQAHQEEEGEDEGEEQRRPVACKREVVRPGQRGVPGHDSYSLPVSWRYTSSRFGAIPRDARPPSVPRPSPNRRTSWSGVSRAISDPSPTSATRSHSASASSRWWVV